MMKKLISVLIGVSFALVLFLNVKINAEQKNGSDIQLKNLEASACYFVSTENESGGQFVYMCCAPWDYDCGYTAGMYYFF